MKVGIIQSNYIPWRGYFDFIDDVDLFVFYDEAQYTKGDWRNRNRIKTARGLAWLTVPVEGGKLARRIRETVVDASRDWKEDHINRFRSHYRDAPHLRDALGFLERCQTAPGTTISRLNIGLIRDVCEYLGIRTPLAMSEEFEGAGARTERLIRILRQAGADTYLSGPAARGYLDESLFREHGIRLEYKSYDYAPYPQLWGPFEGAVSILDLVANTGPAARRFLKSRVPSELVVA